ncbi:MAG: AraC family transcriptional regulator [Bacteroidota bacterium]
MIALTAAVDRAFEAHDAESPFATPLDGVLLLRDASPGTMSHLVLKPTLCVVAQGAKETTMGDTTHRYAAGQALLVTVDVPAVSVITEAQPDAPYLSAIVELHAGVMADVFEGLADPPSLAGAVGPGAFVIDLDDALADCVLRAVRLLDTPDAIPLLYPALQREIGYRLLTGPHGPAIAAATVSSARNVDLARAVRTLLARYTEPIRVGELAEIAHLSLSAFHRQFKALTSMSPIQYQKQVRLMEARRLMLADGVKAESAAYAVGYESASQFSREYARAFGAPPRRDVHALRTAAS